MSQNYYLTKIAEQDIDEIITHIGNENLTAAYEFVDSLYDAFELLADHPLLGHERKDLTSHPLRFWPFKWHYLIVYKANVPIEIARVLSGWRDIANLV
jgi:plasmid stabilization system protein ParE